MSFAISIASRSSANGITQATGPKISSVAARSSFETGARTVGANQYPGPSGTEPRIATGASTVARRHAVSDWMEMEKERGISIASSVLQFPYKSRLLSLVDTPGADPSPRAEKDGIAEAMGQALDALLVCPSPTLALVHGDSHYFKIDKPLTLASGKVVPNFTRVETFGAASTHWVQATVDPSSRNLFVFEPMIVPQTATS